MVVYLIPVNKQEFLSGISATLFAMLCKLLHVYIIMLWQSIYDTVKNDLLQNPDPGAPKKIIRKHDSMIKEVLM